MGNGQSFRNVSLHDESTERVYPVVQDISVCKTAWRMHSNLGNKIAIDSNNDGSENKRLLHSNSLEEGTISQTDSIGDVSSVDINDEMTKLNEKRYKFYSKRSADEESVQYMKVVANDSRLPDYVVTEVNCEVVNENYPDESQLPDYIMDETGLDSIRSSDVSCDTEMTSCTDEDDKDIRWKRFHPNTNDDEIPDYIIHASISQDNLSENILSFFSNLTQSRQVNDVSTTKDPKSTVPEQPLMREIRLPKGNRCLKCRNTKTTSLGQIQTYSYDETVDICDACSVSRRDDAFNTLSPSTGFSQTGSTSIPSIDSGYSAGTLEEMIDKISRTRRQMSYAAYSESETDDDGYMTYVVT